jgi:hypothetical protein
VQIAGLAFLSTKLAGVDHRLNESSGQIVNPLQKLLVRLFIFENGDCQSLNVKSLDRTNATFDLHRIILSCDFEI